MLLNFSRSLWNFSRFLWNFSSLLLNFSKNLICSKLKFYFRSPTQQFHFPHQETSPQGVLNHSGLWFQPTPWPTAINDEIARGSDDNTVTLKGPMNYRTWPTSGQHMVHKAAFFGNLVGFFEALIDDVIVMTHRVWPQKSKIQTQQLLVKERELTCWALSRRNRRLEKKSEIHLNLKTVTVSLMSYFEILLEMYRI